ncbi:MAG: hypothetical protein FWF44_11225 [Defluviitaleaceae bacterium]|nr:hypothetical protein [Defluviitaleaceae bacterium]
MRAGFGLVLTEAAAHGLPLTGFRACQAASELIAPGTGALAEEETPASLSGVLRPLMAMPPREREAIGREARRSLGERFERGLIFGLWEDMLRRAARCKGDTRLDRLESDRWSEALLSEAALEIVSRPHPMGPPGGDEPMPAAAIARLASEKDALERDFRQLQKKYDALLAQYRAAAAPVRRQYRLQAEFFPITRFTRCPPVRVDPPASATLVATAATAATRR